MRSGPGVASIAPHELFRLPIQDQHAIHSTNGLDQHFGHIDPPALVRLRRFGLPPSRRPLRFQVLSGSEHEVLLTPLVRLGGADLGYSILSNG
jgi:hypothetical protein